MTRQRPLGNSALEAINRTAEIITAAARTIEPLTEPNAAINPTEIRIRALTVFGRLQQSLRWLESIGAKTHP